MTQFNPADFPIDPFSVSGQELAARLNRLVDAINSTNAGAARPGYSERGTLWLDTSGAGGAPGLVKLMLFDGANDVEIAEINLVTGQANISSSLPLAGGTVTGPIKGVSPVDPEDLTRKDYVDNLIVGKNVIINGNFQIFTRGSGFPTIQNGFTLDRWRIFSNGAARNTVAIAGGHDESASYCLQVTNTTALGTVGAGDSVTVEQRIEGYNIQSIRGKQVTLSFWVKSPKTGVHCVSFHNGAYEYSIVKEYTVNAADTWEKKTITLLIDTTNGTWAKQEDCGLIVSFTLAAGSTYQGAADAWAAGKKYATANQVNVQDATGDKFSISQVQLEPGTHATNFEFVSYETELVRCMRYYQAFEKVSGSVTIISKYESRLNFPTNGSGKEGDDYLWRVPFRVPMRAIPTLSVTPGGLFHSRAGTGDSAHPVTAKSLTVYDAVLSVNDTGASGETGLIKMTADTDYIRFDAEI